MPAILPEQIRLHVEHSVRASSGTLGVLDIRAMAVEIRQRFPAEDIAIPDIAAIAIRLAGQCGLAVELNGLSERQQT